MRRRTASSNTGAFSDQRSNDGALFLIEYLASVTSSQGYSSRRRRLYVWELIARALNTISSGSTRMASRSGARTLFM